MEGGRELKRHIEGESQGQKGRLGGDAEGALLRVSRRRSMKCPTGKKDVPMSDEGKKEIEKISWGKPNHKPPGSG